MQSPGDDPGRDLQSRQKKQGSCTGNVDQGHQPMRHDGDHLRLKASFALAFRHARFPLFSELC